MFEPGADEISGWVADLSERWRGARTAAARQVTGLQGSIDDLTCAATEVDAREFHRRLFENSARLGDGFVRVHHFRPEMSELPSLLASLNSPCLNGSWEAVDDEPAVVLRRPPCDAACSAATCDAWRESIDGLVVGLTGRLRHTRHASAGHGSSECVDVVYQNPESRLRFGTIPPEVAPVLESVRRFVRALSGGPDVRWLGVSEGELLYELVSSACASKAGLTTLVEDALSRRLGHLVPRELGTASVLDRAEPEHGIEMEATR